MKKTLLLLITACFSLAMQAKVGLIIPADNRSAAENAAATWFTTASPTGFGGAAGDVLTLSDADMAKFSSYSTIWVMVDRSFTGDNAAQISSFNDLFGESQKTALSNFVKDGGNLLLTKQATMLAHTMGRIDIAPKFATWNETSGWDGVGRAISTRMGSCDNAIATDQSIHEIYAGESGDLMKRWDNDKKLIYFVAGGITSENYRYCGWIDFFTSAANEASNTKDANTTKTCLTNFESAWEANVLGIRGGINDYCYSDVVLFNSGYKADTWKGNILAIGSASYIWTTGDHIEMQNLKKLTQNALEYLESLAPLPENPDAETAFLLLTDSWSALPAGPEQNAAQWFITNYINKGKGRFIKPSDLATLSTNMPKVKNIIVHADRTTLVNWSSVNDVDVTAALKTWVKDNGGNLVLLCQATMLAYNMGRISYSPWNEALATGGNPTGSDMNQINVNLGTRTEPAIAPNSMGQTSVDRSGDKLYVGLTPTAGVNNSKLISLFPSGTRFNNRCYWQEMLWQGDDSSDEYKDNRATESRERFDQFETRFNCTVLAVEAPVYDFCLASIIRFKSGEVPANSNEDWAGVIMAIGAGGFQYHSSNSASYSESGIMTTLVENAINSMKPVDPCSNCFLITF